MLFIPKLDNRRLSGIVQVPVSKSMANRSLIIRALSNQVLPDVDMNASNDILVLKRALSGKDETIDFEDAGTPLRLYLAFAALKGNSGKWLKGSKRLCERPIKDLLLALEQLGAVFEFSNEAYRLPLRIVKTVDLNQDAVEIDAGFSSQFVSALMLIAPYFKNGLIICLKGEVRSEPYVEMTSKMMQQSQVEVSKSETGYRVMPGNYKNRNEKLEGDWSSASFLYALVSLSNEADLVIDNLNLNSLQGDKVVEDIFNQLGVMTETNTSGVRLSKQLQQSDNFELDMRHCPDLFPPVLAVCAAKQMHAHLKGLKSLRLKESNRIEAMCYNLGLIGYKFEETEDELVLLKRTQDVHDEAPIRFKSFDDHRIAMALSLFAYRSPIYIEGSETVSKSYPEYWHLFNQLFGVITEEISE